MDNNNWGRSNPSYVLALASLKKDCEDYVRLQKQRLESIKNPNLIKLLKELQ